MLPQSWPRRFLFVVLALTLGMFALAGGHAEAQVLAGATQSSMSDEVSAARRFGGRRAFGRLGKRRMAHRGFRNGGRWAHDRDGKAGNDRPGDSRPGDSRPGDNRPGDHRPSDTAQGDNRPDNPGRPPEGGTKPDPRDHANKPDDGAPNRDGPGDRPIASKVPVAAPPGFGPPGPRLPGGMPPNGTPQAPTARPPGIASQSAFVSDEVLVTVPRAAPESLDAAVAQTHGLRLLERTTVGLIDRRVVRYRIPDRRPVAALVAALRADARILDPQPNYYYRTVEGATPARGLQYALAKVDALRAHTIARGRGALVAVIDTGADTTHPDLAGAIVESFDAVGAARGSDPHGTAIAGIIAANGVLRGVAPDARLLNVRAFAPASDGSFAATTVHLLRGMEWALARRARVLNMSFAGPRDALLEHGITAASEQGAIIVAAAGNNGPSAAPAYPAAYAPVIAVTAIDHADRRYAHANQGRYIALAAPGVDVLTASADHAHRVRSGTSFAAAHVSGIIAMMIERSPGLTADAARGALLATADDLGPPGRDEQYGAGRANAYAAVRLIAR